MHLPFTEVDVLWTLTFAALLVLLVVLLGRDRLRRFPFFTAAVILAAVEMLIRRLLSEKLPPLNATELMLALADLGAVLTLLVALELARRAFAGASGRAFAAGALGVLAVACGILGWWGPWPARETVFAHSLLAHLGLMQLIAVKGDLLNILLFLELLLLAIFTGRRFHAGWRSHARQILLGYSAAGLMQIGMRIAWERLGASGQPRSQAEFDHRMLIETRLLNVYSFVYLASIVWWIACLWFNDPGYTTADQIEATDDAGNDAADDEPDSGPNDDRADATHEPALEGDRTTESNAAEAAAIKRILEP
jgi:hypothetical protein